MKFTYKESGINELGCLINEYTDSLSSPIDSFLEDHILDSVFYKIQNEDEIIGYFSIYKEILLIQFYIIDNKLKYSQEIFKEVRDVFPVEKAFIPTCDELFLSLIVESEKNIENQAYFFQDCREIDVENKVYRNGEFRLANFDDIGIIKEVSGNFFDDIEKHVKNDQLFVFIEENILLGVGIIEEGRLLKGYSSIGMFTNENYRKKGIGRTILIKLKKYCYDNNTIPIAGCWYYNINSKRTLESAGMITKTRLLNITFSK